MEEYESWGQITTCGTSRNGTWNWTGVEDDDQLADWIQRASKFVRALPAKEK